MNDSQALLTPLPRPSSETKPVAAPDTGGMSSPGNDAPKPPSNGPAVPQEPRVTREEVSGGAMGGSSLSD